MNLPSSLRFWSIRRSALLLMLLALLLPASQLAAAEPTKEDAVKVLRSLLSALVEKDYPKAATFLKVTPEIPVAELEKAASKLIELKEISAPGLDILESKGKWGKLADVLDPSRAERYAKKFGVPMAECYGLILGNAEAGFHWDGKELKIIRCDDIGKKAP